MNSDGADSNDDGTIPRPSELSCCGTREVLVGTSSQGKKISSIFAAFRDKRRRKSTNNGDEDPSTCSNVSLILMLSDGSKTYTGCINAEDLKNTSDNTDSLTSLLLEDQSHITISFGLIDLGDGMTPPKVKMVVRERLESGVVKVVWSGYLSSSSSANGFLFVSSLTCSLRDANIDIVQLRTELDKAKADMVGWKDTATKLDDKWQKEKDDLTERFLVLYNRVKKDLRNTRKELLDEKKKKENRVRPMVESALAPAEQLTSQNNDDEEEIMWDADEVELLAAGRKAAGAGGGPRKGTSSSAAASSVGAAAETSTKRQKRARVEEAHTAKKSARRSEKNSPSGKLTPGQSRDENDEDDNDGDEYEASQARANPYSGATEMWGPEGIFADSEEDGDDFEAYRRRRLEEKAGRKHSTTAAAAASGAVEDTEKSQTDGAPNGGKKKPLAGANGSDSTSGEDEKKTQPDSKSYGKKKTPLFAREESDSDSSF
mmetsp:Transcript_9227/g.20668  ORF Transcript_9227/g.20668 Transcript_9227/m.20668 type:complete len:487 (+) Transcript_9227:113-1573(+)